MSKQLYSIFAKGKKPYEDAFDRDIAPTIQRDKFKRLVDISSNGIHGALEELEACVSTGEPLPENTVMRKEYEGCVRVIAEKKELADSSRDLLERWSEVSKEDDDSAKEAAKLLKVTVEEAFPKLQSKLSELEVRNQTEVGRLTVENQNLVVENIELKEVINKSLTAEQITAELQGYLDNKVSSPSMSAEAENQIFVLRTEKSQLEQKIRDHETKRETWDDILEGQVSKKNELKSQLDAAEKQARKSETAEQNLRREAEKSRREAEKSRREMEESRRKMEEKELEIEDQNRKLHEQIELAREASDRADQLNSSLKTKQDRINDLEAAANGVVVREEGRQSKELKMKQELDSVTQSREIAKRSCEKLESELETMKEERNKLQEKLDNAKAEATCVGQEHEEVIAGLVDAHETLGREKLEAQGLLDEARQTGRERDREITELRDTKERLQQQVHTLTSSLADETLLKEEMLRQNKNLQASVKRGTASLERKEKLWRGTEEKLQGEIKQLLKLQIEIDRLTPLESQVAKLQETKASLDSEIRRLKIDDQQRQKLQTQVVDLLPVASKVVGLEKEVMRLAPFEGHVTTLQESNGQLQSKVDRLELCEKEAKKIQAENEQLQLKADRLVPFEGQVTELQDQNKRLQDENSRLTPFEGQATELRDQNRQLQGENSRLTPFEGQVTELRDQNRQLQGENSRLTPFEGQATELRDQNKRLQDKNSRLTPFESGVSRLEREKKQLQANVDQLTGFKNTAQTLEQEKQVLSSEIDRLKPFEKKLERVRKEMTELENQTIITLDNKTREFNELQEQRTQDLQGQLDRYVEEQNKLCEERVASVRAELNEATANLNKSTEKLKEKTSKLKTVEDERDRLSLSLKTQQKNIDDLKAENQTLQDVKGELQRTKDTLTKLRLSETTFNKGRAEVTQLKEKISKLENENAGMIQSSVYNQLAASLRDEKEKVQKATGTINALSTLRDNSKKDLDARIAVLSQKLEKSEKESQFLEKQLDDANSLFEASNESHKSALKEKEELRDKLKNVVPQAVYDQLKQEMVDLTEHDRVCQEFRDKLKNVVPQAVYDQLKQEMVDRTEYDKVCRELAELRLQRSAPWPPREPLSRASSMSSTLGASPTSYASPYAQQHSTRQGLSPSPTSMVQPQTLTSWMTRQLSTASIGSGGSPSLTPAVFRAGPLPALDRSSSADQSQPSVPNVPAASSSMVNTPRPAPNTPQAPGTLGFSFLVSGLLDDGALTINVAASLIAKMNAQIATWNGQESKMSWTKIGPASATRCVEVRRNALDKKRAPPASDPDNSVACTRCIRLKQLCVLIGSRGPVVVPLPPGEKGANASPMSGDYYVKS